MVQWRGICLPVQGTRVQSLVWEDPTYHRATKPGHHKQRSPHSPQLQKARAARNKKKRQQSEEGVTLPGGHAGEGEAVPGL